MITEGEVQYSLATGWDRFSELNSDDNKKLISGCGCCGSKLTTCLFNLLNGLQWRSDQGVIDETSERLSNHIDRIVGKSIASFTLIRWGYYENLPDISDMTFLFSQSFLENSPSYGLNFTSEGDEKWLVVREPETEPVKDRWFNTMLNNGLIPDQVWESPVEIDGYRFYVSRKRVSVQRDMSVITFST